MDAFIDMLGKGVLVALIAVGVLEWLKGFFPKAPAWLWRVLLIVASVGGGALYDGGIFEILPRSGLALAIGQMAYPLLVKIPKAIIKKLIPEIPEEV
jgi:hypothetical protein